MAGTALGAFFHGGLWWTVREGLVAGRSVLWFIASLAIRSSVVVAGICLVSGGRWERVLACLLGFTLSRGIAVRWVRRSRGPGMLSGKEAGGAPQPR